MRSQRGFTLVELVIFIIVMSILSAGILTAMNEGLGEAPDLTQDTQAVFVAQQRMEAIIAYKRSVGYNNLQDPCTASVYPAALCTVSGFTVTSTLTPSYSGNANLTSVEVTVTGSSANYTLNTVLGNFE